MPPPPGMELGPEPPPPPRRLPKDFAFRQRFTGNFTSIIGLAFTGVGLIMGLAMVAAPSWALLLPGFLMLAGMSMLRSGLQSANRMLDAFRNGRAIKGRVSSVKQDNSISVNGQHPWKIVFTFEVDGHAYDGETQTWETATSNRLYGGPPVWVLVADGRPERHTLYPPLK